MKNTLKDQIFESIQIHFDPDVWDCIDESHQHNPLFKETHFKILVVSDLFKEMSLLKRHRMVQEKLGSLLEQIKAFSLHTYTLEQWEIDKDKPGVFVSPQCAHKKS